jgi:molybdopterin biosynthesis enzyme MoaB
MATEAMPHQQGGSADSVGDAATFGVVTVSDRASGGVYQDQSGPAILQFLAEAVHSEYVACSAEHECTTGYMCMKLHS